MIPKSAQHPLVYLACPYSDPDPAVRAQRFDAANRATVFLIKTEGANVFSPITHSHPLHNLGLDGDWTFWEKIDREYLAVSNSLVILTMPGWGNSIGIHAEAEIALKQGMKIRYLNPEDVDLYFADRPLKIGPSQSAKAVWNDAKTGYVDPAPETLAPAARPLKDSGTRKTFAAGAVRDTAEGKGRYDLISPHSIFRIANIFEKGAKKYEARNWEKGMNLSRLIDSALRHTFQYLEGNRDEDHLAQAAWNLMAALHTEEMVRRGVLAESFNDLPNHIKPSVPACPVVTVNDCYAGTDVKRWPAPIKKAKTDETKTQKDFEELCARVHAEREKSNPHSLDDGATEGPF